jgi:hypothetical protein
MTLDNLLSEVSPILNSSQFTHHSFLEVLAARELANEINSGKVSVRVAYAKIIGMHIADYNFINPDWWPVMHHMVGMLSEEKAREMVDTISDFAVKCTEESLFGFSRWPESLADLVVGNLAICAEYIGRHQWAHCEPQGRVKDIIDILLQIFNDCKPKNYTNPEIPIYLGHERAVKALRQINSVYADKLIRDPLNSDLCANFFLSGRFSPSQTKNLWEGLVQIVGTDRLLDALLDYMRVFPGEGLQERVPRYMGLLFEIIKKSDFEKEHIKRFNDELAKWQNDVNFMKTYRSSLNELAQGLKSSGIDLYVILEKKGAQFLDSEVYKPK